MELSPKWHGPLCGEFTGHRWIPYTKASDAELWCFPWSAWINGWVNTREAGDLRRHRAHDNVIVMNILIIYFSACRSWPWSVCSSSSCRSCPSVSRPTPTCGCPSSATSPSQAATPTTRKFGCWRNAVQSPTRPSFISSAPVTPGLHSKS